MILENKGPEFSVTHDNNEYIIPVGKFEVEKDLGTHILFTVGKKGWGQPVVAVSNPKTDDKPAIRSTEPPVEEKAVVEAPEEEVVVETPEEEAPEEEAPEEGDKE